MMMIINNINNCYDDDEEDYNGDENDISLKNVMYLLFLILKSERFEK